MCFMIYVGSGKPLPRREWQKEAPDISVASLTQHNNAVKAHFGGPEVQSIGSTAGCGCDFPCINLQNGAWPTFEFGKDREPDANEQYNRDALFRLLRDSGLETLELYCVWYGDFSEPPLHSEEIALTTILNPDFRFKERGFYKIRVGHELLPQR